MVDCLVTLLTSAYPESSFSSVLIKDCKASILVNCGDNTQRLCNAYKLHLLKLNVIILQSVALPNISGLVGLLMTLESNKSLAKDPNVNADFYSDKWTEEKFDKYTFYYRTKIQVDASLNPLILDNDDSSAISIIGPPGILAVFLQLQTINTYFRHLKLHIYELHDTISLNDICNCNNNLSVTLFYQKDLIDYIRIKHKDVMGKFNVDKAKALNIPPGPLYGQLQRGQSIVVNDSEILPSDVCDPIQQGVTVNIIYYSLIFKKTFTLSDGLLYHIASSTSLTRDQFLVLLNFSKDDLRRITAQYNPDKLVENSTFEQQYPFFNTSTKINYLSSHFPDIFALKNYHYKVYNKLLSSINVSSILNSKIIPYNDYKLKYDACYGETKQIMVNLLDDTAVTMTSILPEKKLLRISNNQQRNEGKLILLGTAGCLPSNSRNVSSSLLLLNKFSILFDCGEATLSQLFHIAPDQNSFDEIIKSLKLIFLSHRHGDHVNGIFTLLVKYIELNGNGLLIVAPKDVILYIKKTIKDYPINNIKFESCYNYLKRDKLELSTTDVCWLETTPVDHITSADYDEPLSYACKLRISTGQIIVFSGDLRPNQQFLEFCNGSDILICEATFEDSLIKEAIKKKHATHSEAISMGAKCKLTILTHFSNRNIDSLNIPDTTKVIIGYDFLQIPIDADTYEHSVSINKVCRSVFLKTND